MKKEKLLTDYSKLPDAKLNLKAIDVKNALTANPNFTSISVSLADFTKLQEDFEEALMKVASSDRIKIALKNQARLSLIQAMRQLALWSQLRPDLVTPLLRQGLRREHIGMVVLFCALADALLSGASTLADPGQALAQLALFAAQHGMLWVGTGLMPSNAKASTRDDLNYLASFSGLMAATPADATPEEMATGDLQTARAFGERIRQTLRRIQ